MKKVITLLSIVLVFMVFASIGSFASDDIKVIVNGDFVETDVSPVITDGRTLLPVRAVCEALGAKVSWEAETETVKVIGYDYIMVLQVNNNDIKMYIGDEIGEGDKYLTTHAEVAPKIISGRVMLPLRAVCEALDASVSWDGESRTVSVERNIYLDKKEDGGMKINREIIKIHGRYAEEDGTIYSTLPASGIEVRFKGTELSVSLNASADAYIHVFTDDNYELYFDYRDDNRILINKGESKIKVAENLPDGIHTVKILKANEGVYNKIGWGELYTDGTVLAPPIAKAKKIQFIGDSITCAASCLNFPENANGSAAGILYEDALLSYAACIGRYFDADTEVFARSGLSMYYCMKGDKSPLYHWIDPFAGIRTEWDHTNFEPDLIIQYNWINEYVGKVKRDGISIEEIEKIYVDVLKMLKEEHPNAKIMMVTRSDQPEFTQMLNDTIEEYGKDHDASGIAVLTYSYSDLVNPGHPWPQGQNNIATAFIPQIEEFMKW